jgi:NADPH:quinone reductase-like Zn-dependent oxidoreductase
MQAIVWTAYGSPDGLQLREVATPTPKDDQVLIKIHATTVTQGDCEIRSMTIPREFRLLMRLYTGVRKPRNLILGQELAGEITAVGAAVSKFKVGDRVFGSPEMGFGAYAQYIVLSEKASLALMPANMTFEEAAGVPLGGGESLHFLRAANIQHGQKVLINGAGGSIGTIGVQLAKAWGADVTAVDSADKLDMLRSIGADHVIDYRQQDFTRNGRTWDVIFDVIGKAPFGRGLRTLNKNGAYLLGNPSLITRFRGLWAKLTSGRRIVFGATDDKPEEMTVLKDLIESGAFRTVIDRRYPLEEMRAAHAYVESGQKAGAVIITVAHA